MTRRDLAQQALEKSVEVREEYGYDLRSPLCIYELVHKAKVSVRFVREIPSVEGLYATKPKPQILIPSERPLGRRAFTCAHEFGHHVFGHGETIDEFQDGATSPVFKPNEFLVDTFAGFVLMPAQGVKRAFSSRSLQIESATPEQIYAIACSFGVGYETLIGHLEYSMRELSSDRATALRRVKLPKIRASILGFKTTDSLIVVDQQYLRETVDSEVGDCILLPTGTETDSAHVEWVADTVAGPLYRAVQPGLGLVTMPHSGVVVRVARHHYEGLAQYRHLEETDDD